MNGAERLGLETQVVTVRVGRCTAPAPALRTTAFFLTGLVVPIRAARSGPRRLPDNLTTFHVIAVAATIDDQYGSGTRCSRNAGAWSLAATAFSSAPVIPSPRGVVTRRDGCGARAGPGRGAGDDAPQGRQRRVATLKQAAVARSHSTWSMPTQPAADSVVMTSGRPMGRTPTPYVPCYGEGGLSCEAHGLRQATV